MTPATTFVEFISEQPGLRRYAIQMYDRVDINAVDLGRRIRAGRDVATLRKLAADPFLAPCLRKQNEIMADALERDPTGRLAAVPSLFAWAMAPDGIGAQWVRWYVVYVNAWIDAQRSPSLIPLQATGRAREAVTNG